MIDLEKKISEICINYTIDENKLVLTYDHLDDSSTNYFNDKLSKLLEDKYSDISSHIDIDNQESFCGTENEVEDYWCVTDIVFRYNEIKSQNIETVFELIKEINSI